ncbi:MAG TPA: hypothetical protein VMT23_03565 [Candidatus Binatia bacterium]|nr:hypothetical protein [Candidatus Binatia bacterium]
MSEQLSVGDRAGNYFIRHKRAAELILSTEVSLFRAAETFSAAIGAPDEFPPERRQQSELGQQLFEDARLNLLRARDDHFQAHDQYAMILKFARTHYLKNEEEYQALAIEDAKRAGVLTSFGSN